MAFWFFITVTGLSLIISLFAANETPFVRRTISALGLVGLFFTIVQYHQDRNEAKEKTEYWDVARMNAFGLLGLAGTGLSENSDLNKMLAPYIHVEGGKLHWECTREAIDAYSEAIKYNEKFPFSYFYRGACNQVNQTGGWHEDIEITKNILRITMEIPGHNVNHDELWEMITKNDFGANIPRN